MIRIQRLCCSLWLALCLPVQGAAENLQVMLQGESAEELRDLVESHSGRLTHFLPIIDAVGAELSRKQLQQILDSGKVGRHIDDLSIRPEAEEAPGTTGCDLGGALEFDFNSHGFDWRLYNKSEDPLKLEDISITWPHRFGELREIKLGDRSILKIEPGTSAAGNFSLAISPEVTFAIEDASALQFQFEHPITGPYAAAQSAIKAELAYSGDCSVSSVPAYENNHEDFYYASVMEADELHHHGIRGEGVTVAVLDSGLWEHQALARDTRGNHRVLARYDAIAGQLVEEAFDESGHGTHLTSVLAHSGPTLREGKATGSFKGIAPDVSLLAVKAFNLEGQGDMLDIVRGIQWVVDNREKYGVRVLNLSFASRPRWPYWLDPVNQAVLRAWAAGIVVVAAAGNEGPEPMTVGSPGNLPYIITVGAITDSWTPGDRSDDYIPDFSSRGPTPAAHIKPDLVAPGGHMTGITRPGSTLSTDYPEYLLRNGEFVMTGSSQAAALVSGLAALLLQLEPDLGPDAVKCMLTSSADPAINMDGLLAYSPFVQGHGLVSITRAITLGDRACGNIELDLARDLAGETHFEGPATVTETGAVSLPGLDTLLSKVAPTKGKSDTRAWGVKAHVERLPQDQLPDPNAPIDWIGVYELERARIQSLRDRNKQ